ncbi:phage/plasmid replication protein, II/X family [Aeromonas caviae]|uniref:Phage/plasmid replication protein, II/X family n=1 Tax=Aeromonas caviae TaxID=648 RepID=A0AAJ6CRX2_AERCA|nr:phage/plasmid replication protein, II/X family [Aeromonas caviae]WFF99877.1 phage/plasmid replication protein, II/X family [Aeromonas caviae]
MDPVSQPVSQKTPLSSAIETALLSFLVFNDFVELRFRFLFDPRCCVGSSDAVEFDGVVSLSTEKTFDVDLKKLASLVPDLRLCAEVTFQPDGSVTTDELKTPFESIESHLGSMAVKVYPRGNARLGLDPYVSAKINPSKISYGFNAFSDIYTLGQALPIAMSAFVRGCPDLAALVDVAGCQVMRVDSTSGVHCATAADVSALLKRISHIQIGHVHAAGSTGTYAEREQKIVAKSGDTVYVNPRSEHQRGAAYDKRSEAREEQKRLTQELRRDPANDALAARVEALSDPDYQAYCEKLLSLEARTMRRGLVGQLERFGITDWNGTAVDLIRCERQLADAGTNFVHSLWAHVWRPVLTALWGDPSMSLSNETELEQKITTYYETHAVGRARSMGTRRALTHLRSIIDRGWAASKKSPPASQATWYRTIGELVDAGISLAALQSCDGTAESRLAAGVVVSLRSVLEVQAVSSAPAWFKPADLSRWLDDQDLMTVPHRHRRAVGDGLVDCIGSDDGLCGPVDNRPDTDAEIFAFLDRSAGHGLGSHAGLFPPELDWDLIVVQSEVADLRVPAVPRHPQLRLV